jgi:hypothetical protein
MNFGDIVGLLIAMGGLMGMIGILGQAYRRRLEHKERIGELKFAGSQSSSALPDRDATIERLEHRIRVLERIATDKTSDLASQIEDLRDERSMAQ